MELEAPARLEDWGEGPSRGTSRSRPPGAEISASTNLATFFLTVFSVADVPIEKGKKKI
jgi:hypothetical protein